MKTLMTSLTICSILLLSCTNQKKEILEGIWDMQYSEWKDQDSVVFLFQKGDLTCQMKAFSKEHYCWIQQNPANDTTSLGFTSGGGGSYKVTGDTITELVEMSPWKYDIGRSYTSTFKIQGDSLIQTFLEYTDEYGNWSGIEIYKRLE